MGWLDECKVAAAPVARLESLPCFVLAPRSSLSFSRDDFQTFSENVALTAGRGKAGGGRLQTRTLKVAERTDWFFQTPSVLLQNEQTKKKKSSALSLSQLQTKANHASSADSVGWSSPRAPALVVIPASVEAS